MDELQKVIKQSRISLEEILWNGLGTKETKGSCLYACKFTEVLLSNFCKDAVVYYRGGDGLGDGGYRDSNGVMQGHYWLEVHLDQDKYVVDITADQFGADPIVIIPLSEASQYILGDQSIIDDHVKDIL